VSHPKALGWSSAFEHRFLSDESFVQTVLMDSPFRSTLINNNLRHIRWPHMHGDPNEYWARMGWAHVGGPMVINASEAPAVFRSALMFARKVDPTVDPMTVRLYDAWMGRKLKGEHPDDQPPLGGAPNASAAAPTDDREHANLGAREVALPERVLPRDRVVRRVLFEDGSSCDCSTLCHQSASCCTDWSELCAEAHDEPASPPCPAPAASALASAAGEERPIHLTFLNLARYPVQLFFVRPDDAVHAFVATLNGGGDAQTFASADTHAWAAKSFSGITVMELQPDVSRQAHQTVEIHECDLSTAGRTLHDGWK
tara:strand:+ start:56 stop:994 length:939 start_codon:yes stop_codon:yes gene_type:complete